MATKGLDVRDAHGQRTTAIHEVGCAVQALAPFAQLGVQRAARSRLEDGQYIQVALQVLADAGQMVQHDHTCVVQLLRVAYASQHQQLRAADGPGA